MRNYILIHVHEEGDTVHHIQSDHKDVDEVRNDMENIIEGLDIDYDGEKNEYISIHDLPDCVTLSKS